MCGLLHKTIGRTVNFICIRYMTAAGNHATYYHSSFVNKFNFIVALIFRIKLIYVLFPLKYAKYILWNLWKWNTNAKMLYKAQTDVACCIWAALSNGNGFPLVVSLQYCTQMEVGFLMVASKVVVGRTNGGSGRKGEGVEGSHWWDHGNKICTNRTKARPFEMRYFQFGKQWPCIQWISELG